MIKSIKTMMKQDRDRYRIPRRVRDIRLLLQGLR